MKKLSIFSLIRLGNEEEAKKELLRRFNNYKTTSSKNASSLCDEVVLLLENIVYNNQEVDLKVLEELTQNLTIDELEYYEEQIIALANNKNFLTFAINALKESMTYQFTYIMLLICNFVSYNKKNKEFIQVIKFYTTSVFFCHVSLSILKDSEEYPYLHHNVHYLFDRNDDGSFQFYLDYPNENDRSLYYDLIHNNQKEAHYVLNHNPINNEEKNRFIHLLNKHNNDLLTYNQVKSFIRDFDNFFSSHYNVMEAIQIFKNLVSDNLETYKYIIEFIMTLLTRCKQLHTLAFSLCCIDFIVYKKDFSRLYKEIELLAHNEALTPYCLIALQKLPNFQAILRRLFKLDSIFIKIPVLNFIDSKEEPNFKLIVDSIDQPFLLNMFLENILSYCELDKRLTNSNLTKAEINRVSKFISYYCSDCPSNGIIHYPNFASLLETFYQNHYQNIEHPHFLNNALLNSFDNLDDENSKKVCSIVFDKIIYEDELTYIDEQLITPNFNVNEMRVMMNYLDYHRDDVLLDLILSNPKKYLKLLLNLSDGMVIEQCLNSLNKHFTINESHLDILKIPEDYHTKETNIEASNLCIICSALSMVPIYFSKLYALGINYFEDEIRYLYYENILSLSEEITLDNSLVDNLELNFRNEKSKRNKNILSKILKFKKINVC